MSKSIASIYKTNKKQAAARARLAAKEATITRLAALPASDASLTDRVDALLKFNRPGAQDPADLQAEEPLPARLDPVDAVAADLTAQAGSDFDGRIGRAVELVKLGQVQFPQYKTTFIPSGATGFYECDCPDSKHRHLRSFFGAVCKHSIAMLLASYLRQQAEAAAHRHQLDKIEARRQREVTQCTA